MFHNYGLKYVFLVLHSSGWVHKADGGRYT